MTWEAIGELDPHIRHPATEGASNPQARLSDMDAMGVDQALLYPTWFAEGFFLVHDPDVAYALARAYNDWVIDFCEAAPDRQFAAAMLPLQNRDFALEETRRRGCGTRNGPRTVRFSRRSKTAWRSRRFPAEAAGHSPAAAAAPDSRSRS